MAKWFLTYRDGGETRARVFSTHRSKKAAEAAMIRARRDVYWRSFDFQVTTEEPEPIVLVATSFGGRRSVAQDMADLGYDRDTALPVDHGRGRNKMFK